MATILKSRNATGVEVEMEPIGRAHGSPFVVLRFQHPKVGPCSVNAERYGAAPGGEKAEGAIGPGFLGAKRKYCDSVCVTIPRADFHAAWNIALEMKAVAKEADRRATEERNAQSLALLPEGFTACRQKWSNGDLCSACYVAPDGTEVLGSDLLENHSGWYWISTAEIDAARIKVQEQASKATARADAAKAREAAAFEEARITGKPVKIERWTEDCDGSVDECSTDACFRLALPDGGTRIERTHTH